METKTVVTALSALAQETRLAVYRLLVQQGPSGLAAGEIASQLGLAPATLSFHLKELSHAGLISARQEGRFIFYAADFAAMNTLLRFLTENCCAGDGGSAAGRCGPVVVCVPAGETSRRRRAAAGSDAVRPRPSKPIARGVKQ